MKVKFADKIYDVLYTMKVLGKPIYAVEDEPNHIDWLVNVEVINEEPKDEEIRKWIIDDIRYNMDNELLNNSEYKKKAEKAILWLKKQGEQKPDINYFLSWSKIDEKMLQSLESIVKDYWAKAEKEKNEVKIKEASNVSYFLKTIQKSPLCWIKCSDGLPNRDGVYFVVTDGLYNEVYDLARYDSVEGWHKASEIIYWMPIPQLNDKTIIEQKPTNKVEPRFKVGDFIVNDYCRGKVVELTNDAYLLDTGQGIPFSCEHNIHLWTIQDAKDGDILACKNGWTCIFKTLINDETFGSYCFMDSIGWFCELGSECHTFKEEFVKAYNGKIQPASKEQRELLFTKMKESGYEWDAVKKQLKKIEKY